MNLEKLRQLSGDPKIALELGRAAEHLVVADLILQGYRAFLTDQGLPYDVVVDVPGKIVRVQVKAACFARNMNMQGRSPRTGYNFSVRRNGKLRRGRLSDAECDVVALVGLDILAVAYMPLCEVGTTCQLMPPGFKFEGRYKRSKIASIDKMPFSEALTKCLK